MMYISFSLPIKPSDLSEIEQMIRSKNIIITAYPSNVFDQYSLGDYYRQAHFYDDKFTALFDRNIFSYIIQVAKKQNDKTLTVEQKTAYALLAFLIISDTLIEPGMASYEYIDSGHHKQAESELGLFRAIDNLDIDILLDIALGRINLIPPEKLNYSEEAIENKEGEDFTFWKLHYGFALKLALIEMDGGKPSDKYIRLLRWAHEDFLYSRTALVFGMIYYSNKKFPKMIKNLFSSNKENLLKGIRNATWDMAVAHHWSKKAINEKENGNHWLLCTEDKALKSIANSLTTNHKSQEEQFQQLYDLYCDYLGQTEGKRVYNTYQEFLKNVDDCSRKANNVDSALGFHLTINKLEDELLTKLECVK